MLKPVRITPPEDMPVSLDEAKLHLRVTHSDEDTLITSLIEAATDHIEGHRGITGLALVTQTWRETFAAFDSKLRLRVRPVQYDLDGSPAITMTVAYFDADGVSQEVDSADYALFEDAIGPYVALQPEASWPTAATRTDAVSVTYQAGFGTAADVPPAIRAAILMLVATWYQNREHVVVGSSLNELPLPVGVQALLGPFKPGLY